MTATPAEEPNPTDATTSAPKPGHRYGRVTPWRAPGESRHGHRHPLLPKALGVQRERQQREAWCNVKRGGIAEEHRELAAKQEKTLLGTTAGVRVTCKERKNLPASFLGGPVSCKGFLWLNILHRVVSEKSFLLFFRWENFGGHFPFFAGHAATQFLGGRACWHQRHRGEESGSWDGDTNSRPTAAQLLLVVPVGDGGDATRPLVPPPSVPCPLSPQQPARM